MYYALNIRNRYCNKIYKYFVIPRKRQKQR